MASGTFDDKQLTQADVTSLCVVAQTDFQLLCWTAGLSCANITEMASLVRGMEQL